MVRIVRLTALVLAVSTIAACDFATGGAAGYAVGVGAFPTNQSGAVYSAAPAIGFYRVTGAAFINTNVLRDTCFETVYRDPTDVVPTATLINAGEYITLSLGARTDTLRRSTLADPYYRLSTGQSIPYQPGDSMIVNIPGDPNGFPASTFRGRTAEAFTIGDIVPPEPGTDMPVTWTPAAGDGAAMLMAFRFSTDTVTSTFNRQVACTFIDDGSAVLPGQVGFNWAAATHRDVVAQRLRSILEQVNVPRSYFNLTSYFERSVVP
jgi:hypothetical protein